MDGPSPIDSSTARVHETAQEWFKLQLGGVGFVGLCGVLSGEGNPDRPQWLQEFGAVAALAGLAVGLIAVALVAGAAFAPPTPNAASVAARRLKLGIVVTFVAIACTALSGLTLWWPHEEKDIPQQTRGLVAVSTGTESACGTVVGSAAGILQLAVDGENLRVPFSRLTSIMPVAAC